MAATAPIFPMPGHNPFDYFCFDPQLDYAQVLAEAQRQEKPAAAAVGEVSKAAAMVVVAEDLTGRKSWKSSLFFWRKAQKKHKGLPPQHTGFKSRCKPAAGPIYMSDFHVVPSCYRSGRGPARPLAAILKGQAEMPYVSLNQYGHGRPPAARPIYLVT